MSKSILNYFGNSHSDYLHARGRSATCKVVDLLNPKEGERILEVGFGTGSTLVEVISRNRGCILSGYELSELMFEKAKSRIQFCGLSKEIELSLLDRKNQFPTADNSFDKVYVESILAIQEGEDFNDLFVEIQRVLRPGGMLIFNETIWLDETNLTQVKQINRRSKEAFGIIQSSHDFPYMKDWKNFLSGIGMECQLELPVSKISKNQKEKKSKVFFRSKCYSIIGKAKAWISKEMRAQWNDYKNEMNAIIKSDEKLMQGIIVKVVNQKNLGARQ